MRTPLNLATEEGTLDEAISKKAKKNGTGEPTMAEVRTKYNALNQDYRDLRGDDSPAAVTRRLQIKGQIRTLQKWIAEHEERVQIVLPKPARGAGEPYEVNGRYYYAGVPYVVSSSIAQHLLHMASEDREKEIALMKQNGREINLGTIGDQARMQTIMSEV